MSYPREPLIAARVPRDTKANFAALAAARGLTESSLLGLLVDTVLGDNASHGIKGKTAEGGTAGRVSVRLRPGDRGRLNARAAARGMRPAGYIAALVRSHVRHDPPLPIAELNALKLAVNQLSMIGRALHDLAQFDAAWNGAGHAVERAVNDTSVHVDFVLRTVRELVRGNLISWESDDA